ncbi:MAG: phosphoglucosamine mutase [Burkholderiales bacterium]|nr:phosphoglucosamine mutase [Burkholderiales bacterium]
MSRKYFGTDGIRGRVGEPPITPEFVMRLGYAAGGVLVNRAGLRRGDHAAVLIGKDTRISGYMLEAALEAGFSAAGVDTMLTGPMPTPAIAYLTRALRLQAGVVISASHNPFEDNGIKFFSAGGDKLPDEIEQEIEDALEGQMRCRDSTRLGRAKRVEDAAGRYIEFCKSTFPNSLDLRGMSIVVDCAHGAAYHIAPHVLHELGADVSSIGAAPDGYNINAGVGATQPAALIQAVRERGAELGLALDGDGDRLIMVDGAGRTYDGDELLYVIATDRARSERPNGIAGTLMTNLALERAFEAMAIPFGRAKVGDRYVLEMLKEKGWLLGGENSGHIICLDRHTTGDGLVSALQVLAAMRRGKAALAQLCGGLRLYPQILRNVPVARGFDWSESSKLVAAKQDVERQLGKSGRVLLRASGTEPVLRIMVEGADAEQVERCVTLLTDAVATVAAAAACT